MKSFLKISVLVSITAALLVLAHSPMAKALSKQGSTGQEVVAIQTALRNWGYYDGAVDGVYGSKTVAAVKYFQRKHGITADGVAGPETLGLIGISSTSGAQQTNNNNVTLLARVVNGEARGESYEGQVAVAAVILNRVSHSSFPNSIAGVVYQPGAFDAVSDGQINAPIQSSCMQAARDAMNGWDPTGGAIYYYNPNTATNKWIRNRRIVAVIGKHVFCL